MCDKCIIIFSEQIFDYMLKTYAHEQAGTIKCCNGITKVYVFEIDNMKIAAYLSHIGSSMAGSDVIDANWLTGASRFIMLGLAGSLDSDKTIGKFVITPFTNQKELINKALKDNGMENIPCGTVHAFQGDEKDVVLFSLAITQQTYQGTYDWLKNNKELINVATSRAKDQLVILSDIKELKRLHSAGDDDIYELVDYVQTNGEAQVTARETSSRALGIKPYSTQTEAAFLTTLNHALDNVLNTNNRCVVQREVSIAHVFQENESYDDLFYTGRFDFVVYEKGYRGQDMPILAIELDGKEHKENAIVRARDEKKNAICRAHGFELLRVENSYARRYNYIKNILIQYFKSVR